MKTILLGLLPFFCWTMLISQNTNLLWGILLDEASNLPIENARVWIPGVDVGSHTTSDGELTLSLYDKYPAGSVLEFYVSSLEFGFHQVRVTVPGNKKISVKIARNSFVGIFGIVRDQETGDPIANVEVVPFSESFAHPDKVKTTPVLTDSYGLFKIILSKSAVGNVTYVRLGLKDQSGQSYKPKQGLFNISSHLDIELERSITKEMLKDILTEDCTNFRSMARQQGVLTSTNCLFQVRSFQVIGANSYDFQVHSIGKVYDLDFTVRYQIIDRDNYKLLGIKW